jgi:hypothetical protein
MDLKAFRATGEDCADLLQTDYAGVLSDDGKPVPGRIYINCLYIEKAEPGYYLLLNRDEHVGALAELEAILHEFAVDEGYFDPEPDYDGEAERMRESMLDARFHENHPFE